LLLAIFETCGCDRLVFRQQEVQALRTSAVASARRANDTSLDEAAAAEEAHVAVSRMRLWFDSLLRNKLPIRS